MEPIRTYQDKLSGAAHEILSAISALNMEPEPIDGVPAGTYLSSSDKWAAHAMEHLHAAFDLIREYRGGSHPIVKKIEEGVHDSR